MNLRLALATSTEQHGCYSALPLLQCTRRRPSPTTPNKTFSPTPQWPKISLCTWGGVSLLPRSGLPSSTEHKVRVLKVDRADQTTHPIFLYKGLVHFGRNVQQWVANSKQRPLQRSAFVHLHLAGRVQFPRHDQVKGDVSALSDATEPSNYALNLNRRHFFKRYFVLHHKTTEFETAQASM